MKQKKAYKYRFYPTDEQKQLLARTFGCCRYVYNWALRERTDAYYKRGERLSYEDTAQRLVLLKKREETSWLDEVSSVPLQQALRNLDRAFRNFFEGRTLVKIDKWYPSSKRCFDCGHILDSLTLDVRSWACPECGVVHDRDINAAKNILAAGLAVAAYGETVRPGAVKTKPGKPQ